MFIYVLCCKLQISPAQIFFNIFALHSCIIRFLGIGETKRLSADILTFLCSPICNQISSGLSFLRLFSLLIFESSLLNNVKSPDKIILTFTRQDRVKTQHVGEIGDPFKHMENLMNFEFECFVPETYYFLIIDQWPLLYKRYFGWRYFDFSWIFFCTVPSSE